MLLWMTITLDDIAVGLKGANNKAQRTKYTLVLNCWLTAAVLAVQMYCSSRAGLLNIQYNGAHQAKQRPWQSSN
jgi:hypothetical protein